VSQANVLRLLQEGISAAKKGNKPLARRLLQEATDLEPDNELAWLWLAGVTESPQDIVAYMQRVLEINPANQRALAGLKWAREQAARQRPAWKCPLCQAASTEQTAKCPSCGAILTLSDLDALLNNGEVDQARLGQTIARYQRIPADALPFTAQVHLGLAYLNLKQMDQALTHLQAAVRLRPDDEALRVQVQALLQREAAAKAASEKEAREEQPIRGMVLVVDDSPTVRKLVARTLEKQDYRVVVAADGLEALAKINDGVPDLIFLDIMMPRLDGYQVCKVIRGNQDTKDIPIIMLSGKDGFFDKVRGRMAGSTDYITKPFEPDTLLRAVEKHSVNHGG
jgi:twitching motility two-component system response regulator PilG